MKYIKVFEDFNRVATAAAPAGRGPGGSGSAGGSGQAAVAIASAGSGNPPPPPRNNNNNNNSNKELGEIDRIIEGLTGYNGIAFFSGTTQENQEILNKLKIVKQKETTGKNIDYSSTATKKDFKQYVAISNLPELKNLLILCTIGSSYDKYDTDEYVEVKVDQEGYYKDHIIDKDIFFIRINGQFRICKSESDFQTLRDEYAPACIKIK